MNNDTQKKLKNLHFDKELTLSVIEGKWKLIILCHIGVKGTIRFSELKKLIPNITQQTLTNQLRQFEKDGIVHREVYPVVPPKVEYSFTEQGKSLMPILKLLNEWGMNNLISVEKSDKKIHCEKELTLSVIEGKWKLVILCHLGLKGKKRFTELKSLIPNITQKVLTKELRQFEKDGLVHRKVYPVVPPKVEYSLTQQGISLIPILEVLEEWGKNYKKQIEQKC
jgi:DNA-binding HxlR family transcriptional regulator